MDQDEAARDDAIGQGARALVAYYKALIEGGIPDGLAFTLVMRFQELTLGQAARS